MGDYLGHLAVVSLRREPAILPRLPARFERPLAVAALRAGLGEASPAASGLPESELTDGGPVQAASMPDPSTERPIAPTAEEPRSPALPATHGRAAMPQPADWRDVGSPVLDESPATEPGQATPVVRRQAGVLPAGGSERPEHGRPPVEPVQEIVPGAGARPLDEHKAQPPALLPQETQATRRSSDHPDAARPGTASPAPVPARATPSKEPASQIRSATPKQPQPLQTFEEVGLRPARLVQPVAGRRPTPAATKALAGGPVHVESASGAPQLEAPEPIRFDHLARAPAHPGARLAQERDLAQLDAALRPEPIRREPVHEMIMPRQQTWPAETPAAPAGPAPVIRVTIGRIEVRANALPAPQPQAKPARRQPPLPLEAYLKGRNQGHGDHR